MTIPLNQSEIYQFLTSRQYNPLLQKETGQTYITLTIHRQEVHVFFVILSEGSLLQTIAYIPFNYKDIAQNDVARLLHLLNKEVDMPGFGMEEKDRLMFYRCVMPCLKKQLDTELLALYLEATKVACESFLGAIGMVATGSAKLDQMLKEAKPPQSDFGPLPT